MTTTPTRPPITQREPAILIGTAVGALITVLQAIQQAQAGTLSWVAAAPVIVGALGGAAVRFGVVSPATYNAALEDARNVTAIAAQIAHDVPPAPVTLGDPSAPPGGPVAAASEPSGPTGLVIPPTDPSTPPATIPRPGG